MAFEYRSRESLQGTTNPILDCKEVPDDEPAELVRIVICQIPGRVPLEPGSGVLDSAINKLNQATS
jgi:hypothetical protein